MSDSAKEFMPKAGSMSRRDEEHWLHRMMGVMHERLAALALDDSSEGPRNPKECTESGAKAKTGIRPGTREAGESPTRDLPIRVTRTERYWESPEVGQRVLLTSRGTYRGRKGTITSKRGKVYWNISLDPVGVKETRKPVTTHRMKQSFAIL